MSATPVGPGPGASPHPAGPRASPSAGKALYSTGVACVGFLCFAVATAAVSLPLWGYYESIDVSIRSERGYFGLWRTCKSLQYERERCGEYESRFQPVGAVRAAGVVAVLGVCALSTYCALSVLQLAMVASKDKMVCSYGAAVITKLVLAILATLMAVVSCILFALQTDDRANSFRVYRGEAFWLQVFLIALNFVLFVMSLYDVLFFRRVDGDPTKRRDHRLDRGTTFNNPGFQERNGTTVSVTDSSGKPYAMNGSVSSVVTTQTTLSSNGSTAASSVTGSVPGAVRSPLRSSLKKPRPRPSDGMGIQNPGFSGTSPTLSRNGSVKKVRIQTHSTAV